MTRCSETFGVLGKNADPRYGFSWRHFTCVKPKNHTGRHKTKDDLSSLRTGLQGPVFWQSWLSDSRGDAIAFHEDAEVLYVVRLGQDYRACPYSIPVETGEPHPHQAGTEEWVRENGTCAVCRKPLADYRPPGMAPSDAAPGFVIIPGSP